MTDQTVTDPYGEIAAELRRVADDLDRLGPGHPAPRLFQLNIQPHKADADDETIAHVDDLAVTLLARTAMTERMSGTNFHHTIHGERGPVSFAIYQAVGNPEARGELVRLRAEIAKLRSEGYGREVDNGDASAEVPAGVEGVAPGAAIGRATVPEGGA